MDKDKLLNEAVEIITTLENLCFLGKEDKMWIETFMDKVKEEG